MPLWSRSLLFAGLLASLATGAGCVTDKENASSPGTFPWISQADSPDTRRDLKNASQLDLTYAQWQEQIGNLPEAEQSYRRVLESRPDSVDAMIGLARLEQLAGRTESAEKAYAQAARLAPGNAQAFDALGQFYASEKRWRDSAAAHAKATEAAPSNATYRQHYAVALARSGDINGSLAHFKQAVGEAEGHYNVGYILFEQGRTDLAEQHFLQAIALKPNLEAAQAMLDELRRDGAEIPAFAGQIPAARQAVMQTAAAVPAETPRRVVPIDGPSGQSGYQPPQWQMPTGADVSSLRAEQMRNQSVLPAGR